MRRQSDRVCGYTYLLKENVHQINLAKPRPAKPDTLTIEGDLPSRRKKSFAKSMWR